MEQTGKQGQDRGEMTGAKALWATLAGHGITTVFGYPGGAIMPVYDALTFYPEVRHILGRHEQGAIHAAEGWAKATGEIGVCIATSGPGATNLVTGLADAMLDSVPLLAITGNVAQHLMGTDAFQEADITGITMPITKHNYVVRDVEELPRVVHDALAGAPLSTGFGVPEGKSGAGIARCVISDGVPAGFVDAADAPLLALLATRTGREVMAARAPRSTAYVLVAEWGAQSAYDQLLADERLLRELVNSLLAGLLPAGSSIRAGMAAASADGAADLTVLRARP